MLPKDMLMNLTIREEIFSCHDHAPGSIVEELNAKITNFLQLPIYKLTKRQRFTFVTQWAKNRREKNNQ
ncbi:hypothetical protein YC2023_110922 [Brassica napus]